jgi:hypothetical protein
LGLAKGTYFFSHTVEDDFNQVSSPDTVAVYVLEDTIDGNIYYFDSLTWKLGRDGSVYDFFFCANTAEA